MFAIPEKIEVVIRIGATLIIGIPLLIIIRRFIRNTLSKKINKHIGLLIGKAIFYIGLALLTTMILKDLGFELTALLGAAGIAGIAIGFAAQTTISNLISGIFLLIEHPFTIGDTITYSNVNGIIESIDLLSTKIKTFSGKLIRVPNEIFLKNIVTNNTYYNNRRISFSITISGKHTIDIISLLQNTLEKCNYCLSTPKSSIFLNKITYFGINYTVQVWTPTPKVVTAGRQITYAIKNALEQKEIKIFHISHIT